MLFGRNSHLLLALATAAVASAQVMTEEPVTRIGETSAASAQITPLSAVQTLHGKVAPKPDLVAARKALIGKNIFQRAEAPSIDLLEAPEASKALINPNPPPKKIVGASPNFIGFPGLTAYDDPGVNSGFVFEPPDQGLAVGNGLVFEALNLVFAIYDTSGNLVSGPASVNSLFGLAPLYDPVTKKYGPSLSDPKAYFDHDLQKWFVTVLSFDVNPTTGNLTGRSHLYIAVSKGSQPYLFTVNAIDTTDDGTNGTPAHSSCPCFGDQPLIGADEYGFYVSTNEFPLFKAGFNGTQIYALSKVFLAEGGLPTAVHFSALGLAESIAYSVQPALSLAFHAEPSSGVEYFLSSLDFRGTLDNRIAVWAMTNTASLAEPHPKPKLTHRVITSEVYGQPPPAVQKPGYYPLGLSIGAPLEQINTNDDRMNQVVFEDGKLWAGVNTIVGGIGTNPDGSEDVARCGISYFVVTPSVNDKGAVSGSITNQGYVAASGSNSVLFPSIGVTQAGKAAMVFTLVGPTPNKLFPGFYPSMAFTRILESGSGNIRLAAAGQAPEDGFSGYAKYGGNGVARWGDYSAAVADLDGSIWMATEWIPDTPRIRIANWGTFIGKID